MTPEHQTGLHAPSGADRRQASAPDFETEDAPPRPVIYLTLRLFGGIILCGAIVAGVLQMLIGVNIPRVRPLWKRGRSRRRNRGWRSIPARTARTRCRGGGPPARA